MTVCRLFVLVSVSMVGLVVSGCGGGVAGSSSAGSPVSKSQACITSQCHGSLASSVTGRAIADEWRASSHATLNVAGCTTCHGHISANHLCASCHGGAVPINTAQNYQDSQAKCKECHVDGPNLSNSLDNRHLPELNAGFGTDITFSLTQGWNNTVNNPPTAADTTGGWVALRGTQYESQCIWCHNPHDTRTLPQHTQWGASGMGDPAAGYTRLDMKFRGASDSSVTYPQFVGESCVRCHTSTGYINWVSSGFTDVRAWGRNTAFTSQTTAKTKQTLYCNVCHDNGNGKAYGNNLRSIPAQGATGGQRIYYNYSALPGTAITSGPDANTGEVFSRRRVRNNFIDYPNIGMSDRCLLCHSGRGGGQLIKLVSSVAGEGTTPLINFRRNGRISTHDFAGGGTLFKTIGFEYYTSSSHYAQPSNVPSHDQVGQGNAFGTGTRGPCVTCHMTSSTSHSFLPVSFSDATERTIASINTSICNVCHASGRNGYAFFNGTVSDLQARKNGFATALRALNAWLQIKSIGNTSNWLRSQTYSATLTTAGFDQTACTPAADRSLDFLLGSRNMGASMNYDYLLNDPGAFVHNNLYAKRLIYDSIDWLDDCKMNGSAETAINFTSNGLFNLGTVDYRLSASDINTVINYLQGGSGLGRPGGL